MEKKQIAHALMVGGVLVVSMAAQQPAFAAVTVACNQGTAAEVAGATTNFVVQAFTPKCSANVDVSFNDISTTKATVKSMSSKGMHNFGGSSDGGSIKACETQSVAYAQPTAGASDGCS